MIKQHLILILFINMSVFAQNIVNEKLIPFHNKEGKWGYLDADSNKVIIPAKYDFANLFENGIATVQQNNPNSKTRYDNSFSGYIRENGEEILPINFTGIYDVKTRMDSIFRDLKNITFENETNGILKLPEGKWLIEPGKYKNFQFYKTNQFLADNTDFYDGDKKYSAPKGCDIERIDFKNQLFYITKGEKEPNKGICTWEGKIIVEPKYINVKYTSKTKTFLASTILGKITLRNIENKIIDNFLFDKNGKQIVTFKSMKIPFIRENESIGRYEFNNKELNIDLKSGNIFEINFEEIILNKNIFQNPKTRLFGFKNASAKVLIKPIYDKLEVINNECIVATKEDLTGVFDMLGNQILPFEYDFLETNQGNLTGSKKGKYGLLSFQGKEIIKFIFKYAFHFEDDLAIVHTEAGAGVIDKISNIIIPNEYEMLSRTTIKGPVLNANFEFKNAFPVFFTAEKDKKWGMFDTKGKLIIPFEYSSISKPYSDKDFLKGWIKTEDLKRNKTGLINIYNNVTIPPIYNGISIFDDYLIASKRTENDYTYQLLDLKGNFITNEVYEEMKLNHDYFIVSKNKQQGIMNTKGEIIVPCKFNYIWAETPNLIRIWDNERYYYINVNSGKEYRIKE